MSQAREALQKSATPAKKTRAAKSAPTEKIAASSAIESAETALQPSAPAAKVADSNAPMPAKNSATEAVAASSAQAKPVAKRSRVPKDLAAQYGGAPESEDVPRHVVEASAPRKRLTRAKKEARSQLLRADDEVLQRLQQANVVQAKKPASRGRGWEFVCGCCGRVSRFGTPAAICECGAIAVRE